MNELHISTNLNITESSFGDHISQFALLIRIVWVGQFDCSSLNSSMQETFFTNDLKILVDIMFQLGY